jgi:hypothetical protein
MPRIGRGYCGGSNEIMCRAIVIRHPCHNFRRVSDQHTSLTIAKIVANGRFRRLPDANLRKDRIVCLHRDQQTAQILYV